MFLFICLYFSYQILFAGRMVALFLKPSITGLILDYPISMLAITYVSDKNLLLLSNGFVPKWSHTNSQLD